jgi:hypothetical protein
MNPWSSHFKEYNYKRAAKRRHRECPKHGERTVCPECVKVVCRKCGHKCAAFVGGGPAPKTEKKPKIVRVNGSTYQPTAALKPVWEIVAALGALRIEPHVDSGQWIVVFPKAHFKVASASELADRVWQDPKLRLVAKPTSFRAGRLLKPELWWVSFELK